MLQTRQLMDNLYCFEDGHVRQFLITAPDKALLLDAGYADSHLREAVQAVTDAPVQLLLTHGDPDHAGGMADFPEVWLHQADWPLVKNQAGLHPLQEGDLFACGDYLLEVIEVPGHTHGSVAFADREKRLLFVGDTVQKGGPIYQFGTHRSLREYLRSLYKLQGMANQFDTLLPCHYDCPIGPEYIEHTLQDALSLWGNQLPSTDTPDKPCRTYQGRWTAFYCTEEDRQR